MLPECAEVEDGHTAAPGLDYLKRAQELELFGTRIARYEDRHRVEWDNHYIENWSLGLDLKILVMTVAAVLRRAE